MKVFMDLEFTGLHQNTTPISIGLIDEHENTFYAEFTDFDASQIDDWIHKNVMLNLRYISSDYKYLEGTARLVEWVQSLYTQSEGQTAQKPYSKDTSMCGTKDEVADALRAWLERYGERVVIWSDCLSYDWMLFCELFGGAMSVPDCVYYIPFDICTMLEVAGEDPDISREEYAGLKHTNGKHNSLHDARVIKACYDRHDRLRRYFDRTSRTKIVENLNNIFGANIPTGDDGN